MSRPKITDETVKALGFAAACVKDQRVASWSRNDHQWDDQYRSALIAIEGIVKAHAKSSRAAKAK